METILSIHNAEEIKDIIANNSEICNKLSSRWFSNGDLDIPTSVDMLDWAEESEFDRLASMYIARWSMQKYEEQNHEQIQIDFKDAVEAYSIEFVDEVHDIIRGE